MCVVGTLHHLGHDVPTLTAVSEQRSGVSMGLVDQFGGVRKIRGRYLQWARWFQHDEAHMRGYLRDVIDDLAVDQQRQRMGDNTQPPLDRSFGHCSSGRVG